MLTRGRAYFNVPIGFMPKRALTRLRCATRFSEFSNTPLFLPTGRCLTNEIHDFRLHCLPLKRDFGIRLCLQWLVCISVGCHGSPASTSRPAPANAALQPAFTDASCASGAMMSDTMPPNVLPSDAGALEAPLNVPPPVDVANDGQPRFGDADVVFHVVNDTGADVFIDDSQPYVLDLRGELVILDPGCGSYCPSCACKECPVEPRRVRRIPNGDSWNDNWNLRVYVTERCGGACPCIREVNAKPGSYTVTLHGKRRANPALGGKSLVCDGRLDERSVECQATATFKLARGTRVELKLTCER